MKRRSLFLLLQPIALSLSMESCGTDRLSKSGADEEEILAAEQTRSEKTFVYDTIGGDIIFTINAGTPIESVPSDDPEWSELAVTVSVSPEEAAVNGIAAGEPLTNSCNETIGQVERMQHFYDKNQNGENTMGILRGFTKRENIDPNSILENIIQNRCANEANRTLSGMEEIVSKYDFVNYQFEAFLEHFEMDKERYEELVPIEEYVLEDSWLSDPGSDRIALIFMHDHLIGIVHKRPMKINNAMVFQLPKRRELIVFPNVNMDITDKLLDLKTEFYNNFFE